MGALWIAGCARHNSDSAGSGGAVSIDLVLDRTQAAIGRANDPIDVGTPVRVLVYSRGGSIDQQPLAQGEYEVSGSNGLLSPKNGEPLKLVAGLYDFYFVSPAQPLESGAVFVASGQDAMRSDKIAVEVAANPSGRQEVQATLSRALSMLHVVLYYETGGAISSLALPQGSPVEVSGLAQTVRMPIDNKPIGAQDDAYTALYSADRFRAVSEPVGTGTEGLSTATDGQHRGIPVAIPFGGTLQAKIPVVINGTDARTYTATIVGAAFEEGKTYTLKVKLLPPSSETTAVEATIEEWTPSPGNGDLEIGGDSGPQYIELLGVRWATGNLVAASKTAGPGGLGAAKIGKPTDGGLYFQFGSLVGYKGGRSGSGRGEEMPSTTLNGKAWGGASAWSWANDAMLWPTEQVNFPTTYPAAPPAVGDPDAGDPCTYYLGAPWRRPTLSEFKQLVALGKSDWTTRHGVEGRYLGKVVDPANPDPTTAVFFPAAGYRQGVGLFEHIGISANVWTSYCAEIWDPMEGKVVWKYFYLWTYSGYIAVDIDTASPAEFGLSVRCVSKV